MGIDPVGQDLSIDQVLSNTLRRELRQAGNMNFDHPFHREGI